jgi:hypothetical protein
MPNTILYLAASPFGQQPLKLGREHQAIESLIQKDTPYEVKVSFDTRVQDIQEKLLKYRPAIVHFSGHGERGGLSFMDDSGQAHVVDSAALAELFQQFADQVRCVVLNACYSEAQARAISRHIPLVIGMSEQIQDDAAIEFSTAFYRALFHGKDIEAAYHLACNALRVHPLAQDLPEEYRKPVLLKQGDVDQARLAVLKAALFDRMEDLGEHWQAVGNYLKQIEKDGLSADRLFAFEVVEKFLLKHNSALVADKFGEFCRSQLFRPATALDYSSLARRLRQGDIALFIGLETSALLNQMQGQMPDKLPAHSLAEVCEYAEIQGSRRDLVRQVVNIQAPATTTTLYQLLAGIAEPLLIFYAAYDDLLERAFQAGHKRYALVFHDLDKNRLETVYSDRADAVCCSAEDFSKLNLMDNGYSLIYRLRGFFRNADEEWLLLAEQDYLRWFRTAKIPDYIAARLRNRSLWFLGHNPSAWEERLLNYIVLEARGPNTAGSVMAVDKDSDAFTDAHWEKRHKARKHSLDLQEFVGKLRQHSA